jgi:NTP pyrophosphatase (non-canonical NTP hydrolase)
MNETQNTIGNWVNANFSGTINEQCAKLREEITEFEAEIEVGDMSAAAEELTDVAIIVWGLASIMGFKLLKAINQKMIINRLRLWEKKGKVYHHI